MRDMSEIRRNAPSDKCHVFALYFPDETRHAANWAQPRIYETYSRCRA